MIKPNLMISAIAVDDEPKALELIQIHVKKIPFIHLQNGFRDALKAIEWLQYNKVDLIFLDINMPGLSGLKFRNLIGDNTMIIFTTAYSEYAAESYDLDAVDYLLKPIPFERFLKSVLKAKDRQRLKEEQPVSSASTNTPAVQQIFVKSGTKLFRLNTADILFLEKDGNYVQFHTPNKRILSRLNMSQALQLLPEDGFMRIHKSFIIGLQHIELIDQGEVVIAGKRLPIAKTYKEELIKRLEPGKS